jgi:aspartate carbamoyltransferase catalytic subunit
VQHLLSAHDLSRADLERLLARAGELAAGAAVEPRRGTVALAFFQDSLRTRVGFDVAAARLGLHTATVAGARFGERMSATERLEDTVRTLAAYCDVLCLRHPDASGVAVAARHVAHVVNGGNGDDEHPSQALIDLFALSRDLSLDGLRIAVVGDLLHMRAAHSLLIALRRFDGVHVRAISPPELRIDGADEETDELALDGVDAVYMAGFAPHTPAGEFPDAVRARYALCPGDLGDQLVYCPLPRIDEISGDVDATPNARYFAQSAGGLHMRTAILEELTG